MRITLTLMSFLLATCFTQVSWGQVNHDYRSLQRCPFTADELSQATGLVLELVEPISISGSPPIPTRPENGAMYFTCQAVDGRAAANLTVRQSWFDPKDAATRIKSKLAQPHLNSMSVVPNDPDSARWLNEMQGIKQGLYYIRGNVLMEIQINGIPKRLQATLRTKLLKLKRLP